MASAIRSEGPYLGPTTFGEGIATLGNTVDTSAATIVSAVADTGSRFVAAIAASSDRNAASTSTAGAATIAAMTDLSSKVLSTLDKIVATTYAGLYEATSAIRTTNEHLTELLGKTSVATEVPFPFGPSLLTNGGAYSYDSGSLYRTWRISLRDEVPAAIEQTYRLFVLTSNNMVVQYNCQFISLPQRQGLFCVALISTTNSGRWVIWRS